MNIKNNKVLAIFTLCIAIIMSVSAVVSSLPTLTPASAWSQSTGYDGKEDPEDLSDFDGSIVAQNKYKTFCVFKGLGMTDNQAVAALACMQAECSFRSVGVESGTYKDLMEQGVILNNTYPNDTLENRNEYIEKYSKMMDTDPDWRTKMTDEVLKMYGVPESAIEDAHKGNRYSSNGLDLSCYYDEKGVGWLGVGMYQWTGGRSKNLYAWSDQTKLRWFEFENQLAFFIAKSAIGGDKGDELQQWIETTKDDTLDKCTETFFHTFINGNDLPNLVSARQTLATQLYPEFFGLQWNYKYAAKVIGLAELEPIELTNEIKDRGIVYSYASAVALYPRNSGMLVNFEENNNIRKRNEEVFKEYVGVGSTSSYSLFELYGEDLHWYRYMGEATYTPNLFDHVWSAIDQHKVKQLISFDTIDYDANNYLSCHVYPDRPYVLSKEEVKNGERDPRVTALSLGWFNGFFYVTGSVKMSIAKYFVAIVAYLTGPEIQETIVSMFEKLESTEVWPAIRTLLFIILGMAMLGFIISLVGCAIRYVKGTGSMRETLERFLIGFLCLGFFFSAAYSPAALNGAVSKTVGIVDQLFNSALATSLADDEIIAVQDESLATHAVLWKTAIFYPWCRGQFAETDYPNLYTQYSALGAGQSKMEQSHETIDADDMTGKAFYDSATLTGDVFVFAGGGKEIRNWAAYLYSCGSIYHIDSTLDDEKIADLDLASISADAELSFPHFTLMTTAADPDIPADLFRVIDAQMNISPQYYANGSVNNNYVTAKSLDPHYEWESIVMLFNAALLIFMFPVIYGKLMAFILLLITSFKIIYFTILEIFKPDQGVKPLFDSIKKSFVDYFTNSLKLCLMITLYGILLNPTLGYGFIGVVLYIVCCFVILGFSWQDVKNGYYSAKNRLRRIKNQI